MVVETSRQVVRLSRSLHHVMNNTVAINKLNEKELECGAAGTSASWHQQYAHSPVIYAGNLDERITEGDLLAIFEQYGSIIHINLVRDKDTGKSKRFAFLAYEDQRSTILAVDNLNGVDIGGRTLRVDHVDKYKIPEDVKLVNVQKGLDNESADEGTDEVDEGVQPEPSDGDELRRKRIMQYLEDQRRQRESGHINEGSLKGTDFAEDRRPSHESRDQARRESSADREHPSKEERRKIREERRYRKEERARIRAEREARRKRKK